MATIQHSKLLSLVLRHEPERIGITLDGAGWTDVAALLAACAAHGTVITRAELDDLVATSDKQRFALSADGTRIRANQGHSVSVDLELVAVPPPAELFHGTVARALPSIFAQGLLPGERHHVHLSAHHEVAAAVGARRGAPVILTVRAAEMAAAGHAFYRSANGVWLTAHVPPAYLAQHGERGAFIAIARTTLAACEAGHYTNGRGERVELGAAIAGAATGTVLHELGVDPLTAPAPRTASATTVTPQTTLAAVATRAGDARHVAALNFASAINPGGGFLTGAAAQEEAIARGSALYPCLLTQPVHYERNRALLSPLYLDLALFSPRVPCFRDDTGTWLDEPAYASMITCAAPNARKLTPREREALAPTLRRRAAFVLAVAAHHRVDVLILGAWGAGAFRNDPNIVADAFAELLAGPYARAFDEVVFAVPPGPNHDVFAARFSST